MPSSPSASSSGRGVKWPFQLLRPNCVDPIEWHPKVTFLTVDAVSALCVLVLMTRLLTYRSRALQRQGRGEGPQGVGICRWWAMVCGRRSAAEAARITISELFDHLVVVLCITELVFYVIDFVYLLDCNGPRFIMLTNNYKEMLHPKTVIYLIIKGALGVVILWMHGAIAYCLHAYTVKKISPARLYKQRRLLWQVLGASAYVALHVTLAYTWRKRAHGLLLGRILFSGLLLPVSLATIAYFYVGVIRELINQGRPRPRARTEPSLVVSQSSMISAASSLDGGAAGSSKTGTNSGGSSGGVGVAPLNRRLAARLLLIVGGTVLIWTVIFAVDVATFVSKMAQVEVNHISVFRSIGLRMVGLVDSVILGADLGCFAGFVCCHCSAGGSGTSSFSWRAVWQRRWWRRQQRSVPGTENGGGAGDTSNGHHEAGTDNHGTEGEPASFLARPVVATFRGPTTADKETPTASSSATATEAIEPEAEANAAVRAAEAIHQQRAASQGHRARKRLFVVTWNMGGVDLEAPADKNGGGGGGGGGGGPLRCGDVLAQLLPRWVPPDQDLYVLGVQECRCLPKLQELLHAYLGGPSAYTMFTNQIGDDTVLHGLIALTLFARTSDVARGAFFMHRASVDKVATGVDLGPLMGRAPNKGMCGLSARFHDASLAFVNAHFCSDKKGRNRLLRRNADAATTLRELALVWDSAFDVHHQHTHTWVLGDLNFRCVGAPRDVLRRVVQSARVMQARALAAAALGAGPSRPVNWRHLSYARLLADIVEDEDGEEEEVSTPEGGHERGTTPLGPYLPYAASAALAPLLRTPPASAPSPTPRLLNLRSSYMRGLSSVGLPRNGLPSMRRFFSSDAHAAAPSPKQQDPPPPSPAAPLPDPPVLVASSPSQPSGGSGPRQETATEAAAPTGRSAVASFRDNPVPRLQAGSTDREGEEGRTTLTEDDTFVPPTPLGTPSSSSSPWAWVEKQQDELLLARRQRLVFWAFEEGRISFPPSYRWHRSRGSKDEAEGNVGLAGDYTSLRRLLSAAYTVSTKAKPSSAGSRDAGREGESSEDEDEDEREDEEADGDGELDAGAAKASSTARTPSYTDRILTHSLPGCAPMLQWRHYDMADQVEFSDHRPVVATYHLDVDASVHGFQQRKVGEQEGEAAEDEDATGADLVTLAITIQRPEVEWFDHPSAEQEKGKAGRGDRQPHDVLVVFPLVSEDPIAETRLTEALEGMLPSGRRRATSSLGGGLDATTTSSAQRHVLYSAFPAAFETAASRRFSQHMLLKLTDVRGKDLGQAVVPIALAMVEGDRSDTTGERRLRFPLTTGGVFVGWLSLGLCVRTVPTVVVVHP